MRDARFTDVTIPRFWAGVFALGINYSAYEAENYRAGLLAIPRGQMEAALSLGMSTRGTERGAPVRSSKNGFGRASPCTNQSSTFDTRWAKSLHAAAGSGDVWWSVSSGTAISWAVRSDGPSSGSELAPSTPRPAAQAAPVGVQGKSGAPPAFERTRHE